MATPAIALPPLKHFVSQLEQMRLAGRNLPAEVWLQGVVVRHGPAQGLLDDSTGVARLMWKDALATATAPRGVREGSSVLVWGRVPPAAAAAGGTAIAVHVLNVVDLSDRAPAEDLHWFLEVIERSLSLYAALQAAGGDDDDGSAQQYVAAATRGDG